MGQDENTSTKKISNKIPKLDYQVKDFKQVLFLSCNFSHFKNQCIIHS